MPGLEEAAALGMAALEEKRFDDAITAFQQALEVAADRPDMNHALGMAYLHRGDAGNGIPYLEQAVQLAEPYDAPEHQELKRDFHLSLATAYQLMDQVPGAARVLAGMVDRWPKDVESRLQLGQLLLSSGQLEKGLTVYKEAMDYLDKEQREAAAALVGCLEAFAESEHKASVFLEGHAESYKNYFDEVAGAQAENGWYAEAARMARGPDGEPVPIVADGARPYALTRVDLVNPADGTVSGVYSEQEPMVVALNGLEPLAQVPILLPWDDYDFKVLVCTRCPWHWLTITVQFEEEGEYDALIERIDERIGDWYLSGYNGQFGEKEAGRFHYITDPEIMGTRAVSYVVDLGRANFRAIPDLLNRLTVLHDTHRIARVVLGYGRLPD